MTALWHNDGWMTPAEVKAQLGQGLAYTTVATVLGRLHAKGLVDRMAQGRAFAYTAVLAESELAGRRIADLLVSVSDRTAMFTGFVRNLSKRDANALRALLDKTTEPEPGS